MELDFLREISVIFITAVLLQYLLFFCGLTVGSMLPHGICTSSEVSQTEDAHQT